MKKFIVSFYEEVTALRRVYAKVECNDESEIKDKVLDLDYETLDCITVDERHESELDDVEMQLEIEKDYDPNPYNIKDFEYENQN